MTVPDFMGADTRAFASMVLAVVLEATPFLLLGSLLSAALECGSLGERLARLVPRGRAAGVVAGMLGGLLVPTCECGVVPVVRRMLARGVPPHAAISFMLSAPVVNPVVLLSTWVAFRGDPAMLLGRVGLVALCSAVIGSCIAGASPADLVRGQAPRPADQRRGPGPALGIVDLRGGATSPPHEHGEDCGCGHHHEERRPGVVGFLRIAAAEFLDMGGYLVLGAVASALFKVLVPPDAASAFAGSVWLAVPAMMLLAMLLSICSEADAFVAASFTAFPVAAQLAFVAIGPMVDLKLAAMYRGAFRPRLALALLSVPTMLVLVVCLAFGLGMEAL